MKTHILFVCLALVALGVFAQTPMPPGSNSPRELDLFPNISQPQPFAPPAPPAKLQELKYFAGTWHCTGDAFATDFGPAHPTNAKVSATWELNRNWLQVRYTEEKTVKNPVPYAVAAYWGWDEGSKSFIDVTVDGMGGFTTGNSPGWNGNDLVFKGPTHFGPTTGNSRDTFTKVSDKELKHLGEVEVKGAWVKLDLETCKR